MSARSRPSRFTVAATAAVLAAAALGVSPGSEPARGSGLGVDGLTPEQQVGNLLVTAFPGTTPPRHIVEKLRGRRLAGVILFGGNIESPPQVSALTGALRRAGGNPIVAVDQEGGAIRRLPWAPPVASQPEQVARGIVRSDARAAAGALRSVGITVSLAPVVDVPSVPGAVLATRSFSSDPAIASKATVASISGWRAGGVAATAKHFPGLGGAPANTDRAIVTIRRSRAQLNAVDLAPFRAAIAAGAPLVMVGHARYPALDSARVASQSRRIIDQLLRRELGFRGVVVTDSLEAQASLATGSIVAVSERAVRAGADLLLLTGAGSYAPVYRHLLSVAARDRSFRERVREAAARVLALKARGALPPR